MSADCGCHIDPTLFTGFLDVGRDIPDANQPQFGDSSILMEEKLMKGCDRTCKKLPTEVLTAQDRISNPTLSGSEFLPVSLTYGSLIDPKIPNIYFSKCC